MPTITLTARHYNDAAGRYIGAFAGDVQPPEGSVLIDSAPAPSYRNLRRAAYTSQLGKDVGDTINTLGDVLDILIAEIYARGAPATPEFTAMLGKVAAIKAAYPKPS